MQTEGRGRPRGGYKVEKLKAKHQGTRRLLTCLVVRHRGPLKQSQVKRDSSKEYASLS